MDNYIIEKMAEVGCGSGDIKIAKADCDSMSKDQRDILDCWHNNGIKMPVSTKYKDIADSLTDQYTKDDLVVLSAYVSARRNLEEY